MISSWFMVTAAIVVLWAVYFFIKAKRAQPEDTGPATNSRQQTTLQNNADNSSPQAEESVWWHQLDVDDQLDLAVQLAKMALPTWEKYVTENEMVYRHAGTGPFIKIEKDILQNVLQDVQALHYSDASNKSLLLHQYYDTFVGPVIAMHDGDWRATYPVKKIFQAVYNLLKSTLEEGNIGNSKNLLSVAINQLLDCLDIAGAQSKAEIMDFLAAYKTKMQAGAM